MKIADLKDNQLIHCRNESEYKRIYRILEKHNIKLHVGINSWFANKEHTYINLATKLLTSPKSVMYSNSAYNYIAIESESITDEETAQPVEPESVNHPAHYGGENNPYEAIKVIEAHNLNFSMGNAVKYILRAGLKTPDKREDLRKAIWCLNREIKRLDSELPRS